MICNFTFHLIYIYINIFFSFGLVGILCWEIHTTTKGLPSLKKKGIHITCVVFSPLQLYPKSSRLSIQHLLIFLFPCLIFIPVFCFAGSVWYLIILGTFLARWRKCCIIFGSTKFHSRSTWPWWIFRYHSDNSFWCWSHPVKILETS